MKFRASQHGFALIAVLAILLVVTILLVAFAMTMRTERAASQNFVDRARAEAIASGMLNRIIAEHAAPVVNGAPLTAFQVNDGTNGTQATGLPTDATALNYFGATSNNATTGPDIPIYKDKPDLKKTLLPIYEMVPDDLAAFENNGLVRTSKPSGGGGAGEAYTKEFWAYDGLTPSILGSGNAEPATVPQWVDYYQPNDPDTSDDESKYPVAQVAFAIWDEGGRFDVNVVGKDPSVNGIAPHDLQVENEITSGNGQQLVTFLNALNGRRDRNDFSLRNIVSKLGTAPANGTDDQGDDRRVFSVRELIQRNLIDPNKFRLVTANSRDFDVRPEWDGDRAPKSLRPTGAAFGAEDFLRSYINNPALFELLYGAGGAGPFLVYNSLNEKDLAQRLSAGSANLTPSPTSSDEAHADWMQVMRLLAVLRRGLPPYTTGGTDDILSAPNGTSSTTYLDPNNWNPFDVWGITQNLIQASDPADDYNLIAYNPKSSSGAIQYPFQDPNSRMGVRLSPYITEATTKVKKNADGTLSLVGYIKIWNPYPYRLLDSDGNPIKYRVGYHSSNTWPSFNNTGLYARVDNTQAHADDITAPDPGQFKVIRFAERKLSSTELGKIGSNPLLRTRPYIQNQNYSPAFQGSNTPESPYQSLGMACYYAGQNGSDSYDQLIANLSDINSPTSKEVRWYSFQIDDPRMGSTKRDVVQFTGSGQPLAGQPSDGTDGTYPPNAEGTSHYKWTWMLYSKQALAGVPMVTYGNQSTSDPDVVEDPSQYNGKTVLGVKGYNRNFGLNWPGIGTAGSAISDSDAAKMLATFALPGRPLLNIGEIGTVFAFRPWVILNFANKIVPDALGTTAIASPTTNKALLRPAAILDYFTTIGTSSEWTEFNNPDPNKLRYLKPDERFNGGNIPPAASSSFIPESLNRRYQDKTWLFEKVDGSIDRQDLQGNLRPIRGRINLNTASTEVLTALLKAPYRMPASLGLKNFPGLTVSAVHGSITDPQNNSDYLVTIQEADARAMAEAITKPVDDTQAIRPLRMLSDLSQLYDSNPTLMKGLYDKYPQSVVNAMIGRLAQFGTVRQQCYTIDMVIRTLNPAAAKKGDHIVTSEARLQARVFFDTFSRKAFIESVQYK